MSTSPQQILVQDIAVDVVRKPIKGTYIRVYPPDGRVRVSVPPPALYWMTTVTGLSGHAAIACVAIVPIAKAEIITREAILRYVFIVTPPPLQGKPIDRDPILEKESPMTGDSLTQLPVSPPSIG